MFFCFFSSIIAFISNNTTRANDRRQNPLASSYSSPHASPEAVLCGQIRGSPMPSFRHILRRLSAHKNISVAAQK